MNGHTIKIRSVITTSLMRSALFRGTFFAFVGTVLLVFAGTFASQSTLGAWGVPLLIFAGGFLAFGLLPYKRLCRIEKQPNVLVISEEAICYSANGKQTLVIPRVSIDKMGYIEQKNLYGIGIWLKHPLPEKIIINNPRFDIKKLQKKSRVNHQCDLFLPYFSKRGLEQLVSNY